MVEVSKSAIAALLILVFVVGYLAYDSYSPPATGQAVADNIPNAGQYAQQSMQTAGEQSTKTEILGQKDACSKLAAGKPDTAVFLDNCMKYMYKFCFSDSDCGPFRCKENKCFAS